MVLLISDMFLFTLSMKLHHSSCLRHSKASDFVTSRWHLEVSNTIVPKIHMPTPLPLWQTYHAFLTMAFIASWNRAAKNTLQRRLSEAVCSLNAPACRFMRFFIKTMNAGIFFVRYLYWTMLAHSECTLSVSAPKWDKTFSVNQLVHHCALI